MSEGLFQVNKGLFFTIIAIFRRPGHSIKEFLEGKRKRYFKPIAYVMLMATIYVVLSKWLEIPTFTEDLVKGFLSSAEEARNGQRSLDVQPIISWLTGNLAYSIIIIIPIFSVASFITFSRQKFNYFEHLILNSYLAGHHALIYALHLLLQYVINTDWEVLQTVPFLLSMAYRVWAYIQFFSNKKWWHTVAFTLLSYVLLFILIELTLLLWLIFSSVIA